MDQTAIGIAIAGPGAWIAGGIVFVVLRWFV